MSGGYSVATPIAQWNPVRMIWETDQADLFCEQREPYSETWPTSGTTRNGQLLPLPTSEHRTAANGSSLLPTPRAAADRTSRSAATRKDSMSSPSLAQAIEIARGELPREFTSWDEVPVSWQP
ncbi:Uncharacterised protein [Mycobacteroides abscessus subsp. abscessus]|nr:Uncharacterised protein [Mycobacteroides abscessus subsp. abscessus]